MQLPVIDTGSGNEEGGGKAHTVDQGPPDQSASVQLRHIEKMAERVGFEPTSHLSATTRFPVVLLRPLGHHSARFVLWVAAPPLSTREWRNETRQAEYESIQQRASDP